MRVLDQRLAVEHDGVDHDVPVTAQIPSHLGHGAAVAADLDRRPPGCPGRHRAPAEGDLGVLLGPGPPARRAAPALLAPHQPGRAAEHRQIDELDVACPMPMSKDTTTRRGHKGHGDHDVQPLRPLTDPDHRDVGQPDQQRAHARRLRLQQGLLDSDRRRHRQSRGPLCRERGPLPGPHPAPSKSEAPHWVTVVGPTRPIWVRPDAGPARRRQTPTAR